MGGEVPGGELRCAGWGLRPAEQGRMGAPSPPPCRSGPQGTIAIPFGAKPELVGVAIAPPLVAPPLSETSAPSG